MKTRQIHGLGLGEFLIFAPAKEMLKSAYFFSALLKSGLFLLVCRTRLKSLFHGAKFDRFHLLYIVPLCHYCAEGQTI